jgi:RNA polymerase sigma-70 factor (ECF subfamily)
VHRRSPSRSCRAWGASRRRYDFETDATGATQVMSVIRASHASAAPLAEGERPTFPALFDAEFSYVWMTLRRLGVRPADLEDVTHDVFVQVYRRLDDFDPARPVRPWLFAFAFRVASDYRRLARNKREVLADDDRESGSRLGVAAIAKTPAPDAALLRAESHALVHEALDALEPERRAVFVLHELDECPIPEVARVLGIPVNTAYTRLRAARDEFSAAIKRLRLRRGER